MTAILESDMLEGLPSVGTDTGNFLGSLAPGLGKFILILAIFGGIGAIIMAIVYLIKTKVKV